MSEEVQKFCKISDLFNLKNTAEANPNSINEVDTKLGWAPLYRCAVHGMYDSAEILLTLGADPNVQNRLGQTSLHQACEKNHIQLIKLLLEYKANPNIQQKDGDTPLHIACSKGYLEAAEILLEAEADPNIPNKVLGRTPLHYACEKNNKTIILLLISYKAIVFYKDKSDLLPANLISDASLYNLLPEENSCKTAAVEEDSNSKESSFEPESEKGFLSTSRLKSIPQFSFGSPGKSSLFNWLLSIKLEDIFDTLQNNGFDDLDILFESMKSSTPLDHEILKKIGIEKIGFRLRFLSKLEECSVQSSRHSLCSDNKLYWCGFLEQERVRQKPVTLVEWLRGLSLENVYLKFVENGFDELEQLVSIMNSSYPLTDEILENDLKIRKLGHRHRILSKLNSYITGNQNQIKIDRKENIPACDACIVI